MMIAIVVLTVGLMGSGMCRGLRIIAIAFHLGEAPGAAPVVVSFGLHAPSDTPS